MIIFKNILHKKSFARLAEFFRSSLKSKAGKAQISKWITDLAIDILDEAEEYSIEGNLWHIFLTLRLCEDENLLGKATEFGGMPSETLSEIASNELNFLCNLIVGIQEMIQSDESLTQLRPLENYAPSLSQRNAVKLNKEAKNTITSLAEKIFSANAKLQTEQALTHLLSFYATHGSGIFALHSAFKWQAHKKSGRLLPIVDLEKFLLASFVGYEEQKKELLANTDLFLSGRAANNVLLFGDSGTGKSSSVKALLNEPGFVRRGLRMIEVHKHQYRDIQEILNHVRDRKYRFVLFIDDLSFEEFEVEYKYLKAIIEGGLECKPDNVVIYATSNRRNLIHEVWKDRKAASDDVHGSDTMQEKHSLASRFGVTIWYGSADKALYLKMIETMAKEKNLSIPKEELERMALRWEVGRGGYTGRTARQFIQSDLHCNSRQK